MIKNKKDQVRARKELVSDACEKLFKEEGTITYRAVSNATNIPSKTLERDPYKGIISTYKNMNKKSHSDDDIKKYKDEIKHLKDIIKKQQDENNSLLTLLYDKGKI